MNYENGVNAGDGASSVLAQLKLAIASIKPDRRQRVMTCFDEARVDIEQALEQQKPMKLLLKSFNHAYDLNVSPQTFRKLLSEVRERQAEAA